MTLAHNRLSRDFTALRDAVVDPSVFFQAMLSSNPDLVITYDVLAYYATLFAWDSSLNFRSVIEGHTSVSEWLRSHNVPMVREGSVPRDGSPQISASTSPTTAEIFGEEIDTAAGSPDPEVGAKLGVDVDMADASSSELPTVEALSGA